MRAGLDRRAVEHDLGSEADREPAEAATPDGNGGPGRNGPYIGVFAEVAERFDAPEIGLRADAPAHERDVVGREAYGAVEGYVAATRQPEPRRRATGAVRARESQGASQSGGRAADTPPLRASDWREGSSAARER